MRDFKLYELNSTTFENLTTEICKYLLGVGVINFSTGRDEGKDCQFTGVSNCYPSTTSRWSGNWVIQAKHTESRSGSFSDSDITKIINGEIERLNKLLKLESVDNYLLFSNRKASAQKVREYKDLIIKKTGIKNVQILGEENIVRFLEDYFDIVIKFGLDNSPLKINSSDIKKLILDYESILDKSTLKGKLKTKKFNLSDKNDKNDLTDGYYKTMIQRKSEMYFEDIGLFLKSPKNKLLEDVYENIIFEYSSKICEKRSKFKNFEEIFNHIFDEIVRQVPQINKKLLLVFLHFMYAHCDIGEEP